MHIYIYNIQIVIYPSIKNIYNSKQYKHLCSLVLQQFFKLKSIAYLENEKLFPGKHICFAVMQF